MANPFRAFPSRKGGDALWSDTGPAGTILRTGFFGAPPSAQALTATAFSDADTFGAATVANASGGGGGSPGPLTYGSYVWAPYPFNSNATRTFAGLSIGPAASDRWVIAALAINNNTSRSLSAVTIGGVAATLLYAAPTLSADGLRFEFWKANVPTGTTAIAQTMTTSTSTTASPDDRKRAMIAAATERARRNLSDRKPT